MFRRSELSLSDESPRLNQSAFQPSLGYLAPTGTSKGMGVFASRAIDAGEVVEIAPIIPLRASFEGFEPTLQRCLFNWESLAGMKGTSAIALGYGSMYNHANPANMQYSSTLEGVAVKFVAVRAIRAGEELTINYSGKGGAPVSAEEGWFEACGVVPIRSGSPDDI